MSSEELTLVVGATGLLGREIVQLLVQNGRRVRAIAREGGDPDKREELQRLGAQVVQADLKDTVSLEHACKGVRAVISTATATVSRREGDSIASVDGRGQLALVEAAEHAGVRRFVYLSFPPSPLDFALQRAKRAVEARLRESRVEFTILQPLNFFEVWLSPVLGFDPAGGSVRVFGTGENPLSWISLHDVARFAMAAVDGNGFAGQVLPLGGPDALSPLQVVGIFRELGTPEPRIERIPEPALEAQLTSAAADELQEAYAATMLNVARGATLRPERQLELLPGRLRTVRQYALQALKKK